jgi:hypothetical protein
MGALKVLSDEQKTKFEQIIAQNGEDSRPRFVMALKNKGYDTSSVEDPAFSLGAEAKELGKGAVEGWSATLLSPEETTGVQKVDLPIIGQVSPSRMIGNIAGGMLPGPGPMKFLLGAGRALEPVAAKAVMGRLGVEGLGKVAGKVAGVAARGAPVAVAGATGTELHDDQAATLEGYLGHLLEWEGLGLLTDLGIETIPKLRGIVQKMRAGDPLDAKEQTFAGKTYKEATEERTWGNDPEVTAKHQAWQEEQMGAGPASTSPPEEHQAAVRRMYREGRETAGAHAEVVAVGGPRTEEQFIPTKNVWVQNGQEIPIGQYYSSDAPVTPTAAIETSAKQESKPFFLKMRMSAGPQYVQTYLNSVKEPLAELWNGNLSAQEAVDKVVQRVGWLFNSDQSRFRPGEFESMLPDISAVHHKLFQSIEQAILTPEEAQTVLEAAIREGKDLGQLSTHLDEFAKKVGLIEAPPKVEVPPSVALAEAEKVPQTIPRLEGGSQVRFLNKGEQVEGVVIGRPQVKGDRIILEVELEGGRKLLVPEDGVEVIGTSVRGGTDVPPSPPATPAFISDLERMKSEFGELGGHIPDGHTFEGITTDQARRAFTNLQDGINLLRNKSFEQKLADLDQMASGKTKPIEELTEADYKEPGIVWRTLGIGSPWSRFVFGRHPVLSSEMAWQMQHQEATQAKHVEWMNAYQEIRKLVGMPDNSVRSIGQEVMGRLQGSTPPSEQAIQKLYQLAQALDVEGPPPAAIQRDPQMLKAYQMYRKLMLDVADYLGLAPGKRISGYLAHIFTGRTGELRAKMLAEESGLGRQVEQMFDDGKLMAGEATEEALKDKEFGHLKARTANLSGFSWDLDRITHMYLRGAADYAFQKPLVERAHSIMERLPSHDPRYITKADPNGRALSLRKEWADYVRAVVGEPGTNRKAIAHYLQDSKVFNRAMDFLVETIGDAEERGILERARKAEQGDVGSILPAMNFLRDLEHATRDRDPYTGKLIQRTRAQDFERSRAKASMWVEDLRRSLVDPNTAGPVASQLYRVQIVAKLGFNFMHGLANLTQTATNLWPMIGGKPLTEGPGYVSRGIAGLLNGERKIYGKTAREIIKESGVTEDLAKIEENIVLSGPGRVAKHLQEFALAPSRLSEQFNRRVALLGSYEKFRDQGLSHLEALGKAREMNLRVNFAFSRLGTPKLLRTPGMKLLLMFKSYPIHQGNFTAELIDEALSNNNAAPLMRHIMAYATLGAATTWGALKYTNMGERTQYPLQQMGTEIANDIPRRGAAGSLAEHISGPMATTLLYMANGQVASALRNMVVPRTVTRLWQQGWDGSTDNLLRMLGAERRIK